MKRILFSSSKGGVGKTTVTVNTAKKLKEKGYKVGILDADIVAPNVPLELGFKEDDRPRMEYTEKLIPVEVDGLKVVSYWFELDSDVPVLLQGNSRVEAILSAFCNDVDWGDCDIILVDCPPTTADELTYLISALPHIEGSFIIVQGNTKLSVHDAKMSKAAFEFLNVRIFGLIQNMVSEYFDDGIDVEKELGLKVIAKIPLGEKEKVDEVVSFLEKEVLI